MTGTIPNHMNLGKLFYFDIGRNNIGGTIPADVGTNYEDLKYLHIDHNQLSGSIPTSIPLTANGRMISLLANNNLLSGAVPDNWIQFNKLVQFTIQGKSSKHKSNFYTFCCLRGKVCVRKALLTKNFEFTGVFLTTTADNNFDYMGPDNCQMSVFAGGQCVEFKTDCYICRCDDVFCDRACSANN